MKELRAHLTALSLEYEELRERDAGNTEWADFEAKVMEQTSPLILDMERHQMTPRPEAPTLLQLAKYGLPKAAASRGNLPTAYLNGYLMPPTNWNAGAHVASGLDYWMVAMLCANALMILTIGYLYFGGTKTVKSKTAVRSLHKVGQKIPNAT